MELPPPRSGDWSSANRHLTAGGTVEGIPWGNPYLPYIKQLMEQQQIRQEIHDIEMALACAEQFTSYQEMLAEERLKFLKAMLLEDNPCGKPHNNGEDTCNECIEQTLVVSKVEMDGENKQFKQTDNSIEIHD